jgi:tight adherence protein B
MNVVIGVTLAGGGAKVAIAILVALAVLACVLAWRGLRNDSSEDIEARLRGYQVDGSADPSRVEGSLAESATVQELIDITGRVAERVGVLTRVEEMLEQGDLPVRPSEALFFYVTGLFMVLLFGFFVLPSILVALILTALVALAPAIWLNGRRKKRLRKFQTQLPDTLNLMSGAMRAGFAFIQALETVSQEVAEPSRTELQRVFTEAQLGRAVEDALGDAADRMHSPDLNWSVMAVRIQREVGGNLAEILETVADTMKQRERLRREILALTAEGRMSAIVLGIFPPGFAVFLYMMQPAYMGALLHNTGGIIALIGSGILAGFGFLWLKQIMKIEV